MFSYTGKSDEECRGRPGDDSGFGSPFAAVVGCHQRRRHAGREDVPAGRRGPHALVVHMELRAACHERGGAEAACRPLGRQAAPCAARPQQGLAAAPRQHAAARGALVADLHLAAAQESYGPGN